MPEVMQVIALISGGKDSFYSALHCMSHGHNVVAFANLIPPNRGQNLPVDMESMMYQTIGHDIVKGYELMFNRPVYQQEITGTAQNDRQDYAPSMPLDGGASGDEAEDLLYLLMRIKKDYPLAAAVCSGAVLSTYQRTRVESVVTRLGMIPLSYLWQYPYLPPPKGRQDSTAGLLEDMMYVGVDAKLVKIASAGIKHKLLGKNVAERGTIQALLSGLRRIIGDDEAELRAAVLGEGGEYETLTSNGPWQLFWKYLHFDVVPTIEEGEVVYGNVLNARVLPQGPERTDRKVAIPRPLEYDYQFQQVETSLLAQTIDDGPSALDKAFSQLDLTTSLPIYRKAKLKYSILLTQYHAFVSNLTCYEDQLSHGNAIPAAASQLSAIRTSVRKILARLSYLHSGGISETMYSPANVVSTILLLSNMCDFPSVNQEYQEIFRHINPPARVTVATTLPGSYKVSLSFVVELRPALRRGLHVQSWSYWAPANIGPYSQAITEPLTADRDTFDNHTTQRPEYVHVAGQIPLIPSTMKLVAEAELIEQVVLSCQHLWRIGQERKVDSWIFGAAFIPKTARTEQYVRLASEVWAYAHHHGTRPRRDPDSDGDNMIDVWDQRNNRSGWSAQTGTATPGSYLHDLPNDHIFVAQKHRVPPFIAVEVEALPRYAPIEWWSAGVGKLPQHDKAIVQTCNWVYPKQKDGSIVLCDMFDIRPTTDRTGTTFVTISIIPAPELDTHPDSRIPLASVLEYFVPPESSVSKQVVSGHCFIAAAEEGWQMYDKLVADKLIPNVALIPCKRVWVEDTSGKLQKDKLATDPSSAVGDSGSVFSALLSITLRIETIGDEEVSWNRTAHHTSNKRWQKDLDNLFLRS